MSKFKGTKGPWDWQNDESGYSWLGPKDCGLLKAVITDGSACGEYEPDIDVSGHNAHLIAAAPDLLEELQLTLGALKEICFTCGAARPESTIRRAEAAIAKALGETK